MTSEKTQQTIDALEALLERERTALMDGDLDFLVGQFDEKKTLIDTLNGSGEAGVVNLEQLQAKAQRNQALLDSALQGIRSVTSRMNALHRSGGRSKASRPARWKSAPDNWDADPRNSDQMHVTWKIRFRVLLGDADQG